MKFLLDTNFLLIPGQFKVDVFSELTRFGVPELYTLDLVIKELKRLAEGRGKAGRNAKLALTLVEEKDIKVLPTKDTHADREMERIAAEQNFIVCTVDKGLINRLIAEEIPVVRLRQKRNLELVRH